MNAILTGTVGTSLPSPLVARVVDSYGAGMPGVTVSWEASAGELTDTTMTSDASGLVSVGWRLGTIAGPQQLLARVQSLAPATFIVTALPGTPTFVRFNPSSLSVFQGTIIQLFAEVGPDLYGNRWPSTAVVWSSSDSIVASVTADGRLTTARAGNAIVRATVAGMTAEGVFVVRPHWRAIGAGRAHTCALDHFGYAFCWGDNSEKQLGIPDSPGDSVPIAVSGDRRYAMLTVGREQACGLTAEYVAFCWGLNATGQLGIGTLAVRSSATPMLIPGLAFAQISAGNRHACAITTGFPPPFGIAYCWGWEAEGELGNGNHSILRGQPSPQLVQGGLTFRAISAGDSHSCAITVENAAYCWGNDYDGQVGDASTAEPRYRPVPTAVVGGHVILRIAAGGAHTCATTITFGTALCWGSNQFGQLGDGTFTTRLTPTQVAGLPSHSTLTAGLWHTCALTTEGEAWCWGRNDDGQLGDGTTVTQPAPVRVQTALRFTSLTAGWTHTCGATSDGEAYCWGAGSSGELGTGARERLTTPALVAKPR